MTNYDLIADEYFSARHQTCRGFDAATIASIHKHVPCRQLPPGPIVELCAGIGRLTEYTGYVADIHVDSSIEMLRQRPRERGVRVLADARHLPFIEEEFSLAAAFLCDPALTAEFVQEVYRVLAPGGTFIFSTPASEWATALRGGLVHETTFVKADGSSVTVPSNIYDRTQLLQLVSSFYSITFSSCTLPTHCTPSGAIIKAARAAEVDVYALPIVNLISCRK